MSNRDFVDDDLIQSRPESERVPFSPVSKSAAPRPEAAGGGEVNRPVTELDINALARHRQQIDTRSAVTAEELEKLRRKEEELQRQKRELEEARRKHDDYIKGKDELMARLGQSLVVIERHEIRAEQTAQLLKQTRLRFRELLETLRSLQDEAWTENEMRERLTEALAMIEDARMEYNKSTARIEAFLGEDEPGENRPVIFDETGLDEPGEGRTFLDWLRIGFAFSLPLVLTVLAGVLILLLHLRGIL